MPEQTTPGRGGQEGGQQNQPGQQPNRPDRRFVENKKPGHGFDRNRLLSHLRITVAATLIGAAVVSAIASFQPDPPNTRLTNDNPANGGYVSAYTLATGNAYTDATLK